MPICNVLTIAGSDSSGGAGIQADLKTMSALGVYGMSVITALTAQNTRGVTAVHVPPASFVRAQIEAVFTDIQVHAVKVGMLADAAIAATVADAMEAMRPRILVLDPVMVAKGGDALLTADAVDIIRGRLLPLATVITPNLAEAEVLLGREVSRPGRASANGDEMTMEGNVRHLRSVARAVHAMGARAVYLKGGQRLVDSVPAPASPPMAAHAEAHHPESAAAGEATPGETMSAFDPGLPSEAAPREAVDVLFDGHAERVLRSRLQETRALHGTGCSLSSAIACLLARGRDLHTSAADAKSWLTGAIAAGGQLHVGSGDEGFGPVHHFHALWDHARSAPKDWQHHSFQH